MNESSYRYEALDLESHSFRLLLLHAGTVSEEIHCDVFLANLDDTSELMPYEALSYTWGGAQTDLYITANGQHLRVTDNLHNALQHIRRESEGRLLWIDAICIDQQNPNERGHQVQRMGEIYKKAERLIVWLGAATAKSDIIMQYLRTQSENVQFQDRAVDLIYNLGTHSWERKTKLSDLREEHVIGFQSLLNRPWFRRVWIIQEITNARAATIMCGNESISSRVFSQFPSLSNMDMTDFDHQQSVIEVMPGSLRHTGWYSKQPSLRALLHKFRKAEAMEPVDKIYALLGISSDAADFQTLRPEYDQPLPSVIRQTTLFLLSLSNFPIEDLDVPDEYNMATFLEDVPHLELKFFRNSIATANLELTRKLICSIDFNFRNVDGLGRTALHIVIEELAQVSRSTIKSRYWQWPGRRSAESKITHFDIIKHLLGRKDVDVDAVATNGETALSTAINLQLPQVAEAIVEERKVDKSWPPAFQLAHRAYEHEHYQKFLLLLARTVPDSATETALWLLGVVDINASDEFGNTALINTVKMHTFTLTAAKMLSAFDKGSLGTKDPRQYFKPASPEDWRNSETWKNLGEVEERAFELVLILAKWRGVDKSKTNYFGRSASDYTISDRVANLLLH